MKDRRFVFVVFVLPVNGSDVTRRKDSGFDRQWKAVFINWLRRGLTIREAAKHSGVTRRHVYRCRRSDDLFRREWDAVLDKRR